MNIDELVSKYNVDKLFLDLVKKLNLNNAKVENEYPTTLFYQYPRIIEHINMLIRAEKKFFGANLTLKNLKDLKEYKDIDIYISFFAFGDYGGKFIRDDNSIIGFIAIEKGNDLKIPPLWDGTMDMLLEYNGK